MKLPMMLAATLSLVAMATANLDDDVAENERYLKTWIKQTDNSNKQQEKQDEEGKETMEYANEFQDSAVRSRREVSLIRRERSISKEDFATKINLVSFHEPGQEHRVKRATYNTTTGTWPHRIPYLFNSSYPEERRPKVRRIMQEIMDNLCVTFVEEPDFDPRNNDYETNAYMHFVGSETICGALVGQGSGTSGRRIMTCTSFYTITHEIMHSLGMIHEQQGPLSMDHISLAPQNVIDNHMGGTYSRKNEPGVLDSDFFDPSSIMMYSRRAFTRNGLDIVLPLRRDELTLNNDQRTNLANNYAELNKVYKCQEKFCGDEDVDCGIGYLALIKGTCQCVCPRGLDPAANCQEFEDENSGPAQWPDTMFTVYTDGTGECPDGFTKGTFDITGTRGARSLYTSFPSTSRTTNYHLCTRTSTGTDMDALPMGTYCVVKPVGNECNGGFHEGGYIIKSEPNITYSGDFGDWEILDDPNKVKMKFCCRVDREVQYTIELPRKKSFTLISENGKCPTIEGLRSSKGLIVMFVKGSSRYNSPQSWLASYYLIHGFCKYTPADYGCHEEITLDSSTRKHTLKTPGFDSDQRTPNMRCFYYFKVPAGARVKVTMDHFDVDSTDHFDVRRYHKWALPQRDFANNFKKEFISISDFMFLEWWAGAKSNSKKKGVQFTAEVLLEEDNCYPTQERGKNYIGRKSVTENFEECLPWKDAASCDDFPFYGSQSLDMMSHNYCRNPSAIMERPWCYVSVDKGVCRRAYCDVCNELDVVDQMSGCASLIAANPTFCKDTLQRMKCAETCGLHINVPSTGGNQSCTAPPIPIDGSPTEPIKDSYYMGEIVSFTCDLRDDNQVSVDIECTMYGWPVLKTACSECPTGWIPYGDRCYYYHHKERFVDEADNFCKDMGGRMFVIRHETDLRTLRFFKRMSRVENAFGGSWVNAQLRPSGNWTLYDDESFNAPFLEWADYAVLDDTDDHGCVVMIWEKDPTHNAGKFNTTSCNLAKSRTFCEIPRKIPENHNCTDWSTSCVNALINDPDLCSRTNSYHVASQYCQYSCGECAPEDHETCSDPQSSSYTRISHNSTTLMGDVMEFECNSGLYLISGNLRRVCGHKGQLLGPEPVCTATPVEPESVGVSGVLLQNDLVPTNQILLMDVEGFRIPFAGNVSQWHVYGLEAGYVHFVVYRNVSSGGYQMVGFNKIAMGHINDPWTYQVPSARQIQVMEGDVFGVFTLDGLISATSCSNRKEAIMQLKKRNTNSMDTSMIGTVQEFGGTACLAPSIALTVQP